MGISPWTAGDTHRPISSTFVDDSGVAVDLTGATLSITFDGPTRYVGTGTFVVLNAAAGTFTYQFSAADVALANVGDYALQFVATFSDGTYSLNPVPWALVPAL
jgi:hypothetical protein